MVQFRFDLSLPLRAFRLELALEVGRETVALIGPSGAGKTTVLRALAGLLRPERGRIALGERVWLDVAGGIDRGPEERPVGFVFQDYALFPHMTVAENVAFGGRTRAGELLERFRIAHLAGVRPGELSGGERQRVALARALARDPKILLLDEPLSALDAYTRAGVRAELHEILRDLALPTLLVTHDFQDAGALADRVGVLADGRVLQLGTPSELLAAPTDPFVAGFTGANLLPGLARRGDGGLTVVALADGSLLYSTDAAEGPVSVVVYPWEIAIGREPAEDSALNHVRGRISTLVEVGNRVRVQVGPLVGEVTAASAERLGLEPGHEVVASFKATATRVVPGGDVTSPPAPTPSRRRG